MPLTDKGKKMMDAMVKEYGDVKGPQVFYATIRKKKMKGMEPPKAHKDLMNG